MRAYSELFLDDAMTNLGEMLEYACLTCEIDATRFWRLFIISGLARDFGNGVPAYVCGMSGSELAMRVLEKTGVSDALPMPKPFFFPGEFFWCGWILAYYQWLCGDSFEEIERTLPLSRVLDLYNTLHEASEDKFVEIADAIRHTEPNKTNLARLRKNVGLTQACLAELSGVKLRTLQQYESRAKDINKAQGRTLLALATALQCNMRDLMEPALESHIEYACVRA